MISSAALQEGKVAQCVNKFHLVLDEIESEVVCFYLLQSVTARA